MAVADYPGQSKVVTDAGAGQRLCHALDHLAVRRARLQTWSAMVRCLVIGVAASALMVLAYRLYLVDGEWWMLALPLVLAAATGWRVGRINRGGALIAAMDADQALGLQDRLSSALAFVRPESVGHHHRERAPLSRWGRWRAMLLPRVIFETATPSARTHLVPALVQDAAARCAGLEPQQLYPLRLDRPLLALVGLSVLLAGFCLMPDLNWFRSAQQQRQAAGIVNEGKQLAALAKEIQARREANADAEAKRLAHRLALLARRMQRGHMGKRTALVEMGQLRKDLEKAAANNSQSSQSNPQEALQDLQNESMQSDEGKKLKQELQKGDQAKAADQLDKLANKLDHQEKLSEQEKQQAAHDLKKAADALRRQGGQQNQEAAKQLDQAAKSLQQKPQSGNGKQQQSRQQGQGGQNGGSRQQRPAGNNSGSGSQALRRMAQGMRQGAGQSGNSQSMRDMLNKIQEAERNTGSNGNGQEGAGKQPGQGKGNGKNGMGQGEGKEGDGLTPGTDIMPTNPTRAAGGAGLGPRGRVQQHSNGGGVSSSHTKRTGDKRRWADQWSDRLPGTRRQIDRITGKYGSQGEVDQLPTRSEAGGGQMTTPNYEVPPSYRKDAEDAISKETVPPAYKEPVRNYFDSFKDRR